ncbi:MAG TPA: hypothetical protein PKD84_04530 [Propionicimonas sp.]|nr:hypothetical protein [Propionicimonas sp.]
MINESALALGAVLGAGNFADIMMVDRPVGAGLPSALVYKRFRSAPAPAEIAHLGELIRFRKNLRSEEQFELDRLAAWPLEFVIDAAGALSGVLMPCAPKEFMFTNPDRDLLPATVGLLFPKAQRGRKVGAAVPGDGNLVARLMVCAQLAHALDWLHRRQVVFGDLSQANELFTIHGSPRIYLIDTDTVSIPGSRVPQPHTPNYIPPEIASLGDFSTAAADVYKFTCLLVRIVSRPREQLSQRARPEFVDQALDGSGIRLIERGLSARPADRPSMSEFYAYLYNYIASLLAPPVVESIVLNQDYVLTGTEVRVEVVARQASQITVRDPSGVVRARGTGGTLAAVFRADATGRCTVTASNQHGTVEQHSTVLHILPRVKPHRVELLLPPHVGGERLAPVAVLVSEARQPLVRRRDWYERDFRSAPASAVPTRSWPDQRRNRSIRAQ